MFIRIVNRAASVREAFEAGVLSGTGVTFVPEAEVRTVSEKRRSVLYRGTFAFRRKCTT